MKTSSSNRPEDLGASACRAQCVRALARREHSRLELERKLQRRGYTEEVIVVTLDWLEDTGLLDAGRFTESFVRSRISRGQGPDRIERELTERGIDRAMAIEVVATIGDDWEALAREVRRRRFGAEPPAAWNERARQSRFLQYRGFSAQQIRAAFQVEPDLD